MPLTGGPSIGGRFSHNGRTVWARFAGIIESGLKDGFGGQIYLATPSQRQHPASGRFLGEGPDRQLRPILWGRDSGSQAVRRAAWQSPESQPRDRQPEMIPSRGRNRKRPLQLQPAAVLQPALVGRTKLSPALCVLRSQRNR